MKIMRWIFVFLVCISGSVRSQQLTNTIQSGNNYFNQQQYEKAAAEYNKVLLADPANVTAKYNLATSLYKAGKQDEAATLYVTVATDASESILRSKAWYNKGVILTRQKKLEESIEAYKNALRQNPNDKEARENLQKALLELKKKNPTEKKKEEDQKKKKQEPQKKQPQPKMSQKEAEQRLKLLEQKEKEVQQRLQKEKAKSGAGQTKDW